jgi:hypothetical protein
MYDACKVEREKWEESRLDEMKDKNGESFFSEGSYLDYLTKGPE